MNPLVQLRECGQSPWYDYISRRLMTSGELQAMVDRDGLMGITSNPSIFEKAIAGSEDYDEDLKRLAAGVAGVTQIYESLAIRDIQEAADLLTPVYQASQARDGYVSLEVSPHLAFDTQGTIEEALRLYKAVDRKNVMIKVPGTPEGLPAIEHLIGLGMNINITLLFSVEVYEQVAWTYIRGLEKLAATKGHLGQVASVASFFVSRIDTLVDRIVETQLAGETDSARKQSLQGLLGKVAIANAKLAYAKYLEVFSSQQFRALQDQGAQVQRLLWASTGTKNPRYPDTYYVDNLIGPDTVNTMPAATFAAFRDHGVVASRLQEGLEEANRTMATLADLGISMREVTETLLMEGAKLFGDAFEQLMVAINRKRLAVLGNKLDRQVYAVGATASEVKEKLAEWRKRDFVRRLWAQDATLWHQDPKHQDIIRNALGWLTITGRQIHDLPRLKELAAAVQQSGYRHVLLLGMGGSSLCPEVFRMTFGTIAGYPELHVLDSTVPAQVRSFEQRVDLSQTLCIVASKSGTTTEPLVFQSYFYDKLRRLKGDRAGEHFMAITDPGSMLEQTAKALGFRYVLPGVPEIGGRYSALSNFGLVPAALMGVNVEHLLYRAERMRHSCEACLPPEENPGVVLGATLGLLAKGGRDKLSFVASPTVWDLGAWLEQLIAESTGKEGTGIIPVDDEPLGLPEVYGTDRVFVYIRHADGVDPNQEAAMTAMERAGHPVIRIEVADLINLGQEFFLWEMATAVAGAILGINAFDQPNVQESKDYTKAYLETFKQTGRLPETEPLVADGDIRIFSDEANAQALSGPANLEEALTRHLGRVQKGDYVALNAYVERTEATHRIFQRIRTKIRDVHRVATTLGYGPRFLHSTGQLHKGGPNSGVFLQITSDDVEDLPIPGEPYTFGALKSAQALGDMKSLTSRNRRVIRVHLGSRVLEGLERLEQAVEAAVACSRC